MEMILAGAIGVLCGSGVWLLLRPRTFQVIMGLSLISYAVNLFIFSMGRLKVDSAPVLLPDVVPVVLLPEAVSAAEVVAPHDGHVPGGDAGLARAVRHRPRGRQPGHGMVSTMTQTKRTSPVARPLPIGRHA